LILGRRRPADAFEGRPDYFQPLLWQEVPLGNVSDKDERQAILDFVQTARSRPELAGHITAIRLVKPHRPPAGPPSAQSLEADKALKTLCRALSRFSALTSINLPGAMVSAYLAMDGSDVPLLSSATLSGPPSDAFLGLRNLQTVRSLRLDHPWLATPAFFDRVHIQLDNLTALHLHHFALSTSHPALSFLLGGPFGKRLTELSIHLSPECPSPIYSTHLLSLVPNLTYLSLSVDGVDLPGLPLFAHLRWFHLHDSQFDLQRTDAVLNRISVVRSPDALFHPLPALRAIQLDMKPWSATTLRLADVGVALLGPDDDVLHDQDRVIDARLEACKRGQVKETVREAKRAKRMRRELTKRGGGGFNYLDPWNDDGATQ
jgi:hypothetical protein